MATRYATKTGNWSDVSVWDGGASKPGLGDTVVANGFTVTIDEHVTVTEIRTELLAPAVAGGAFVLANGINVTGKVLAGTTTCLLISSGTTLSTITGNVTGGSASSAYGIYCTALRPLAIVGNVSGGTGGYSHGVSSTVGLTIIGNVTASTAGAYGIGATSNPLTIVGDVSGNASSRGCGVRSANLTVTGNVVGCYYNAGIEVTAGQTCVVHGTVAGSDTQLVAYGIAAAGGTVTVVGDAVAGKVSPAISVTGPATVRVSAAVGNGYGPGATGISAAPAITTSVTTAAISVDTVRCGIRGAWPIGQYAHVTDRNAAQCQVYESDGDTATLVSATIVNNPPAPANVRLGTGYTTGNSLVGTCAVPAAGSVALGVPVDATEGTAVLTPAAAAAAVWTYLVASIPDADLSIGARLKNAATVAAVNSLLAAAITD